MKICFVSYEYEPFPGGGIATYHNAAVKALIEAGHEVHVVTNRAWHGANAPHLTQRYWQEGNLTIHRIRYFDENRNPPADAQFFDVNTANYVNKHRIWARDPSNLAAHRAAAYVEALHAEVGLDVVEAPEFFAEAFYMIRRRKSGDRWAFPPVCVHGHISSRIAFAVNHHVWELGYNPHRHLMRREEYCIRHADALITPSRALMERYEELFPGQLPKTRAVIPYFLDLPPETDELPQALNADSPYICLIGRVEPRKGPDLAMRAFAEIADDYPDLRLVLMGKEMWHQGETVDDVIASMVPEGHRGRVVRLGQVRRERALAAAKQAVAFVHPAPWDNYPCAVLEAMGVGATCIVSDRGGQSEMVEDETSGLVFRANDAHALALNLRRVLQDRELKERLARNAVERVHSITHPTKLVEKKIAVFYELIEREKKATGTSLGPFVKPAFLEGKSETRLPGNGMILLDAAGSSWESLCTSRDSLWNEVSGSLDRWDLTALLNPGEEADLSPPWILRSTVDPLLWLDIPDDHVVVYVAAGTRLDLGALRNIVAQVIDDPSCGSFGWVRPATAGVFPYAPDFSFYDVLVAGHPLPPIFAVRAEHLKRCTSLGGLFKMEHRLAALPAAAAADGKLMFQHVGQIVGDFYGDLPLALEEAQLRSAGYLEVLGLLPAEIATLGGIEVPVDSLPPASAAGSAGGSGQTTRAVGGHGPSPERLRELEDVFRQHMKLKNMGPIRWLRKVGAFDVARRMFPKSKGMIGGG